MLGLDDIRIHQNGIYLNTQFGGERYTLEYGRHDIAESNAITKDAIEKICISETISAGCSGRSVIKIILKTSKVFYYVMEADSVSFRTHLLRRDHMRQIRRINELERALKEVSDKLNMVCGYLELTR